MNFANLIQRLEHAPRPAPPVADDFDARVASIDIYVEEELERLEQTWSEQEHDFLAKLRNGQVRPPSGMDAAVIFAIGAFLGGMFSMLAVAMFHLNASLQPPAALLGGAAFLAGSILSLSRWKQAADYERFMKAYEAYRDVLLSDYKRMVAERIGRQERDTTG